MTPDQFLLQAIATDPGDGTAWLALSDCLEEQGQVEQAELVRLRERLRFLNQDRKRTTMQKRLQQLLASGVAPVVPRRQVALSDGTTFEFVLIPPGQFRMGSPINEAGRWNDESPLHNVTLSRGFWLGRTMVTAVQWHAVTGSLPRDLKRDDCPVVHVSYHACIEFCGKLHERTGFTFRLPTEAEWEYACRACTRSPFYTGRKDLDLDRASWYGGNSEGMRHAVAGKEPNAWGLYDMHGNAWEWCEDGRRMYPAEPATDPRSIDQTVRVARGGSYSGGIRVCRSACRDWFSLDRAATNLGCRLAMDL